VATRDVNQTLNKIPGLLDKKGTMLYIGAWYPQGMDGLDDFKKAGYDILILEVFEKSALEVRSLGWKVKLGDVRKAREIFKEERFDVVVWWHGPEHVDVKDLPSALEDLKTLAKRLLVVGCPRGKSVQGVFDGNPYEKHVSTLVREDLIKLGLTNVLEVDRPHRNNVGHLTAWWERRTC